MKVLDPAAFSTWCTDCNLTKPHNTAMDFIPTTSGGEPRNTNKKAFTVHSNADKLKNLHLSYSPTDDIIFNNVPGYAGCNCYSINYP